MELSNRLQTLEFRYSDVDTFNIPVRYHYVVDFNNDGIDELLTAGFETQPNTPEEYDSTKINIFGWVNGLFSNLTGSLLPGQSSRIEGTGDVAIGDFNGDGLIDFFTTAGVDMTHTVNAYQFLNTGNAFVRNFVGQGEWAHGSSVYDLNDDGYDDVIPAGYFGTQPVLMGGPSGLSVNESNWVAYGSDVAIADFLGDGSVSAITVDTSQITGPSDTQIWRLFVDESIRAEPLRVLPTPRLEGLDLGISNGFNTSHDIRVEPYNFNDDDLIDAIVFSRGGFNGSQWVAQSEIQFLTNRGNGQFIDETEEWLFGYDNSRYIDYSPIFKDFNLDGRVDIFLSEADSESDTPMSTSILIQNQDGTFTDSYRAQFSSEMERGDLASLLFGPDDQIFLVIDRLLNQSYQNGGAAYLDLYSVSFPERETSEVLRDTSGGDRIYGLGGNDTIFISAGRDLIDGGSGIDRVVFPSEQVAIQLTDIGYVLGDITLINVERIEFSDVSLALDLDGLAGQTAKTLASVIGEEGLSNKQYVGIGLQLFDAGHSLAAVCELALNALGAITNEEVVTTLHTNLFGEAPSHDQLQEYVGWLDQGVVTKGSLAAAVAELTVDVGIVDLIGLAETGIEYI